MKINGYIYLLIDKRNEKKYVGKHNGSLKNYFTGGKIPKKIIKKYGKEIFERIILENNISDESLLNQKEKEYIKQYDTFNSGYNLTEGGDGGGGWIYKLNNEEKEIIANKKREKTKGVSFTEEHKQNIRKGSLGKKLSEKHKENIKKSNKKSFLGKKHSEETKEKIRKKRKGVKCEKHSKFMKENNPSAKKVIIDGIVYNSIQEASEKLNMNWSSVRFRLNSKSKKWENWNRININ